MVDKLPAKSDQNQVNFVEVIVFTSKILKMHQTTLKMHRTTPIFEPIRGLMVDKLPAKSDQKHVIFVE
ncbi:hypothetical protein, partial [Acinetobacter baumannii]|uniref:hypothetical protein n=1 Tax=Acinetobacter baumannii TaxID=470 RepID=UPI001C076878